jgi:hypothetical protein
MLGGAKVYGTILWSFNQVEAHQSAKLRTSTEKPVRAFSKRAIDLQQLSYPVLSMLVSGSETRDPDSAAAFDGQATPIAGR